MNIWLRFIGDLFLVIFLLRKVLDIEDLMIINLVGLLGCNFDVVLC